MNLSVLDAAAESPARLGLIAGGRGFTFAELAARTREASARLAETDPDESPAAGATASSDVRAVAAPVIARRTVETAARLYALWELGRTAVLVARGANAREVDVRISHTAGRAAPLVAVLTSGSTGRPRAALLSRGAVIASARASAANLGWRPDDRWLCPLPLHHVGGVMVLARCLLARRCAVLADDAPYGDGWAAATAKLIADAKVTLASLVPTMLHDLVALAPGWRAPAHLRAVVVGGAAAEPALLARARAAGIPALASYGMTETCSQVCTRRLAGGGAGECVDEDVDEGVGPPLVGVEIRIADGRILVRGPMLFDGYASAQGVDDAGGTRGARGAIDADGFVDTGDLGFLDARGCLHVMGRADDVIVTGGDNVHPAAVERAVLAEPAVRQACAFGVPDPRWGMAVAIAVVTDASIPALAEAWRALPGSLRPRRACALDALPRLATGKLDRAAVARAAAPLLRPISY